MMGGKQLRLVGAIGFVILLVAIWFLLDWSKPSPETITGTYRLMDLESNICIGSWASQGGRTSLILRDSFGIPRVILQADQIEGGRMSLQDANGQWHYYPAPPPD
jgi:hypothetical protein